MKKTSTRPAWSLSLALEPRMMFDAAAVTTAAEVADAGAAATTAPEATATPVTDATFSIDAQGKPGSDARLFNNASVTSDSSGQEISKLVVTVSTSGSNQALVVDGTAITLASTSAFGETTKSHYAYSVAVKDGSTTLTLFLNNANTVTPAAVETLINGISYRALDGEVSNGQVKVTLTSLSDIGNDVSHPDISATVTVDNDKNLPPRLDGSSDLNLLDDLTASELADSATAVSYSLDGDFAYVVSSSGTLVIYSVSDSGVMSKIQTFSDADNLDNANGLAVGKESVYVLSGSSVVILNRATDGKLSFGSRMGVGDESAHIAISEDGGQLFVSARWNGIYVYDIGTDGALSYSSRYTENTDRAAGLTVAGEFLFVMSPGGDFQTLSVFKRSTTEGVTTLVLIDATTVTSSFDYSSSYQLAASSDGRRVYTLNTRNGDLIAWYFNGTILTKIETRNVSSAADVALSRDGSRLYVSSSDGQLSVYAVSASGALTLLNTQTTGGSAALASSGTSLAVVGGSSVEVYTAIITYTVGSSPVAVTAGLTASDSNLDVLNNGAGNYKGATIVVTATGSTDSQFSVASDSGIRLQGTQLLLDGEVIGSAVSGANTLTVNFTRDVTTATANQVLRQILWATSGTGSALVTLSVVVNDGQLNSNSGTVLLRINTIPHINPTVADGFTLPEGTSETEYWLQLPDLFRDGDGDNLSWTVSGLPDGLTFNAETQTISGSTTQTGQFTLTISVKDSSGTVASLARELQIAQIDNRMPEVNWDAETSLTPAVVDRLFILTLDPNLFSDADAIYGDSLTWRMEGLPDGLTFDAATRTISGTATSLGDSALTVTVTDKSGDSASRELSLRTITADEDANTRPTLTPEASTLVYTRHEGLSGYDSFVGSIALSDEGTRLVVIGSTGPNWGGTVSVTLYSRDTVTGELRLLHTFTQGRADDASTAVIEMEGLKGNTQAAFSADGNRLYLAGTDSSDRPILQVFTLSDDGTPGMVSSATLNAAALKLALSQDGRSLYAVTASGLYRFGVDAQGTLSARESFTDLSNVLTLDVDDSGTLYVASSTGTINVYTTDDSGSLSYAGRLTRSVAELTWTDKDGKASSAGTLGSGSGLNGTFMQISAGAEGYLYVVTGTNGYLTVLHFDADSGGMKLISSRSVSGEVGGFPMSAVVSKDGTALYVGTNSSSLVIYTIGDGGQLTYTSKIAGEGAMIAVAISADGKSVYGGSRFYKNGLRQFDSAAEVAVSWTERESTQIAKGLVLGDVDYDAANEGAGNYSGAVISIAREYGANADDSYDFVAANGLTLENGTIMQNGKPIASFTVSEGLLTVTFTADVSTAVASQVLHQISWQSTSRAPGSSLSMVVSLSDPWTTASQTIAVNVVEVNDAPEVTAQGNDPTYRDTSGSTLVFGNAAVDTVEIGQKIVQIDLTVSGLVSGENDFLMIDGTNVLLQDGVRVLTNDNIVITVSVKDGVASLTIASSAGIEADQAQSLINSMGYGNPDAYLGSREIVLTGIRDDGGTARGGSDSSTLDIRSTVSIQAQDAGPKLTSPETDKLVWAGSVSAVSGLGSIVHSTLSADGTRLYVTDGSGKLALFERDNATGKLTWIKTVSSGFESIDTLTVLSDSSLAVYSDNTYSLSIISVANDGTVTQRDTTTMWGVTAIHASDNGELLYVFNQNGISIIRVDAVTGKLTTLQDVDADAWSEPHLWQVVSATLQGEYLYVITDPTSEQFPNAVIVYQRQADGTLALFGAIYDGRTDASGSALAIASPSAIAANEEGSTIYVQTESGLQIFSLNLKSGQIVRAGAMSDITGVTALAQGGGNLYVTLDDGSLQVYAIGVSGQLTLSSRWSNGEYGALDGASRLLTTRDGGVVVAGNQLASLVTVVKEIRYTVGSNAELNFSGSVTLSHKALDLLNDGKGNYGGASITVHDDSGRGHFSVTDSSGLILTADGQVQDNGTVIGTFTRAAGTLTVLFADGVTSATANRVVTSLVYLNADNATGRNVTLSIAVSDGEITSAGWQQHIVINHAPQVTDSEYSPAVIVAGKSYTATLPAGLFRDADGDSLSWGISGLPPGIVFDAATLTLNGTATAAGVYILTVTVTDGDGASATRQLSLRVNTPPEQGPGETRFSLPSGTAVSMTLEETLFTDADGDSLVWAVNTLPAGLSFDADTRTLSGTLPSGHYRLTLTATDPWGSSVSRELVLQANRAPQVTEISFSLPEAKTNTGWQQVLPADLFSDKDGDPLTWQIDGLPAGLSFDAETHTLRGQAIAAGRYVLTVNVTDPWGGMASRSLILNVIPAQPEVPVEPDRPVEPEPPVDPEQPVSPPASCVNPVILDPRVAFPPADDTDRERFIWQESESNLQAVDADAPRNPLVMRDAAVLATGPLDYSASPWQLDPLLPQLMPTLENVNFTARSATAPELARMTTWRGEWMSDGHGTQVYALPPGLAGRGGIVSVQLANGRPLPEWMRFDATRSELQIKAVEAARVGQIQLRLMRADGAPTLLLTLHGAQTERAVMDNRQRLIVPLSDVRTSPSDGAFNQGISHSLDALRGDSDDLLQVLSALARG